MLKITQQHGDKAALDVYTLMQEGIAIPVVVRRSDHHEDF
jgi:hypothetical protein